MLGAADAACHSIIHARLMFCPGIHGKNAAKSRPEQALKVQPDPPVALDLAVLTCTPGGFALALHCFAQASLSAWTSLPCSFPAHRITGPLKDPAPKDSHTHKAHQAQSLSLFSQQSQWPLPRHPVSSFVEQGHHGTYQQGWDEDEAREAPCLGCSI